MPAVYCSDCGRNVLVEIGDSEINDFTFDDSVFTVTIEVHMLFVCAECGSDLGEYTGVSEAVVPKLEDYIENHEEIDASDAQINEDIATESKIIKRNGRKTFMTKWGTQVILNKKVFKVTGELAVTQDLIDFYSLS